MNPITDSPEPPAKKKRVIQPKPEPVEAPVDPNYTKAMNWKQSNVMTREQWERHLKTLNE